MYDRAGFVKALENLKMGTLIFMILIIIPIVSIYAISLLIKPPPMYKHLRRRTQLLQPNPNIHRS